MNQTRKGFLTASTILTIVSSVLAILLSFGIAYLAGQMTEEIFKETYQEDSLYTYYEEANGEYYFLYTDENGTIQTLDDSEIQMIAKVARVMIGAVAVGCLAFACTRLILAIIVLKNTNKKIYKKGLVITLLVFDILEMSVLEIIFLGIAMVSPDKQRPTEIQIEASNIETKNEDNSQI